MLRQYALKSTACIALLMAIILLLINSVSPVVAQETEQAPRTSIYDGRWYQVEIIVFAHKAAPLRPEQWRKDIALAYPPNWLELKNLDETPPTHSSSPATGSPPGADTVEVEVDLTTMPYYKLPESEQKMTGDVKRLERDRKYRVLYHEAWRQPVYTEHKAPWLLIKGGDQFDNHHELEGSLSLSVSRYLHLSTNLWYSRFTPNYGQANYGWPELPAQPAVSPNINLLQTDSLLKSKDDLWEQFNTDNNEYQNVLKARYLVEKIITIEQKRRMRSREVHYIDHPAVGILIYTEPYEAPEEDLITQGGSNDALEG